jgi:hypothetical protein
MTNAITSFFDEADVPCYAFLEMTFDRHPRIPQAMEQWLKLGLCLPLHHQSKQKRCFTGLKSDSWKVYFHLIEWVLQ